MADTPETRQYLALLVQTWQKTQDDIDKAILSLSGGALGVSFVFLKDIVGPAGAQKPGFLFSAWICWATSCAFTLLSFLTSRRAFAKKIKEIEDEIKDIAAPVPSPKKLRRAWRWCFSAGGLNFCTSAFNSFAAALFVAGVVLMIVFTAYNLEALRHVGSRETTRQTTSTGTTTTTR
jgi:drug/metabolite transporter (DMT)-like permease